MRHESTRFLAALVLCGAVATPGTLGAQSNRPVELTSSVGDGFTIAVVGDGIIAHSLEHLENQLLKREAYVEIVRRPAPDFGLRDAEGRTISLSDLRGKVVVIDFFFTT